MDTRNVVDSQQQARIDRGFALAAVIQAIPNIIWIALTTIFSGFLLLALFFNHAHIEMFVDQVLLWADRLLIVAGVVLLLIGVYKCYRTYHQIHLDIYERRSARSAVQRQQILLERARLQNEQLQVRVEMERQLPLVMRYAIEAGHNIEWDAKGGLRVQNYLSNLHALQQGQGQPQSTPLLNEGQLPEHVRYEDVRDQVPQGHVLIGVGHAGIETKEHARCGACVWIVGLSGTGKTSTTVLRVEERHSIGHKFLGADPHWFKPDSLTNAVAAYADDFLLPMARTPEEMNTVYHTFLDEFFARRAGNRPQPWQKITLLTDEVGAQMDATTNVEKENAKLLPQIARICGQEARNFHMGGIFVSQLATGLAWLRKVALMVIVHQLLMKSEKELAVNGDVEVVNEMKFWPIGRTYVYGVGFGQDGPTTVQQPFFERPGGAWRFPEVQVSIPVSDQGTTEQETEELPIDEDLREALEAWRAGATGPRAMQRALGCTYYQAQKAYGELIEKGFIEVD